MVDVLVQALVWYSLLLGSQSEHALMTVPDAMGNCCEGSGCAVCAKLDEHGLLCGKKAVAVEGGVPCEHVDCQHTFTKAERRAKWYHLQYHPQCMNPCALCAKRTAEQPPGRLRSQWHATHPHR